MTLSLAELFPLLNAADENDLVYWTAADLWEYAAEASQRLARSTPVFVEQADVAISAAGGGVYANPARHVALMEFTIAGARLKPSSTRELAALSDAWELDECAAGADPDRWLGDIRGHDYCRVYPLPVRDATVEVTLATYPADVSAGAPGITAPAIVADYLLGRTLAEARRQEGVAAMPEVATAADQEADLLEQAFQAYWGKP